MNCTVKSEFNVEIPSLFLYFVLLRRMHEMSNNFLTQTFIDKIQTENLRVKNPNSLDGNTALVSERLRVGPEIILLIVIDSLFQTFAV